MDVTSLQKPSLISINLRFAKLFTGQKARKWKNGPLLDIF